ncbi:Nucleoside diphosphate-linked moiety X motif 19, mitochondrial [Blyttiomyces sp. JEL0837]|nr:Nucleoside diphosphate-linked moiety X motif 19, mitochondrial [Blyttiomyces sp. JEL0837]
MKVEPGTRPAARSARGAFGSLHVFPGGVVDPIDEDPVWNSVNQHKTVKGYSAYAVAAVRETFEECGIPLLNPPPSTTQSEMTNWREKVHQDGTNFKSMCAHFKTEPALSGLFRWAHWITPVIEKKRFDTQFFLSILSQDYASTVGSDVSADGNETVSLDWFTPAEALEAFKQKKITLFPPQYLTLLELSQYSLSDLRAFIDGTKQRNYTIESIMPEPAMTEDDGPVLLLPGDEKHSSFESKKLPPGSKYRLSVKRGKQGIEGINIIRKDLTQSKL